MTRIPRFRLLFSLVVVLTLTLVPVASARPLEAPAVHDTDGGWLGSALKWVEDLIGLRRPAPPRQGGTGSATIVQKTDNTTNGGSCIDPQGSPRPWCM